LNFQTFIVEIQAFNVDHMSTNLYE